MKLYATLVGPLLGNYVEIECRDELDARCQLTCSKLKELWCSLYTLEQIKEQEKQWGLIQAKTPKHGIVENSYEAEKLYNEHTKTVNFN